VDGPLAHGVSRGNNVFGRPRLNHNILAVIDMTLSRGAF